MTETREQTMQRRRARLKASLAKLRCEDGTAEKLEQQYGLDMAEKLVQKACSRPSDVVNAIGIKFMPSRKLIDYMAQKEHNLSDATVAKITRSTIQEVEASRASASTEALAEEDPEVKKIKEEAKQKEEQVNQRVDNRAKSKTQQQNVSDEVQKRTEQINNRIDSKANQQQKQLPDDGKKQVAARLAEVITSEVIARQGEELTKVVKDIENLYGKQLKVQYLKKYSGEAIPKSYCLAIQRVTMNKAVTELLGEKADGSLKNFYDEFNKYKLVGDDDKLADMLNIDINTDSCTTFKNKQRQFLMGKNRKPISSIDIDKSRVPISSFINEDKTVKKGKDGKPLLKDGDIMLVHTGSSNSGYHAIRINVDEQGKVTYTAGNNEHINDNVLHDYKNKGCLVFSTQDFLQQTLQANFEKLPEDVLFNLNLENTKNYCKFSTPKRGIDLESKEEKETVTWSAEDIALLKSAVACSR